MAAPDLLAAHASHFNQLLPTLSPLLAQAPGELTKSILYSLSLPGKRLRPALIFEAAATISGEPGAHADVAALAIELIHTFSLVHDDLPAMDNDDFRRGMPTNHKVFGEALAILAGDGMICVAVELLCTRVPPSLATALCVELMHASGPAGMIGGQALDMALQSAPATAERLTEIHTKKTAALIRCSLRMGALSAGASADQLRDLSTYGEHIGLAFQIVDDILDLTSTREQLGKGTQKDEAAGKSTYPTLHGLAASQKMARHELDKALAAISSFGHTADGLTALARFVVERAL